MNNYYSKQESMPGMEAIQIMQDQKISSNSTHVTFYCVRALKPAGASDTVFSYDKSFSMIYAYIKGSADLAYHGMNKGSF